MARVQQRRMGVIAAAPRGRHVHEGPIFLSSGHAVYTPPVEFDVASAPDVIGELELLVDLQPHIAVDLSGVQFLDSSALSALLYVHKRAAAADGDVVLFGASERTLKLLAITQLDQVLSHYAQAESIPPWSAEPSQP